MRESKAELTDRLRREGRWDEFKKRREELKAGGVPADQAWEQAATEFPPPVAAGSPSPSHSLTREEVRALMDLPPVHSREAITWAFDMIDVDCVEPSDAPSLRAWTMRSWARSSSACRMEFMRQVFPLILEAMDYEDEQF